MRARDYFNLAMSFAFFAGFFTLTEADREWYVQNTNVVLRGIIFVVFVTGAGYFLRRIFRDD